MAPHSRKSTSRGPLQSKKEVIMTLLVIIRTALDFFGEGELRCFHCWLYRGSKWWHHISSPVMICERNSYSSSWYHCKWLRHAAILSIICHSISWCVQIFQNCRWSLIMACTEPWLMPTWTWICSSVICRFSRTTPSIRAVTSRIMGRWACPGHESSCSNVHPLQNLFCHLCTLFRDIQC